ncbi:hypothetical protein DM02DRAFT_730774 [Periconia macrospinosa]|uniref:Uncharacterized protein n=1 Tax=Periconia macrospinosa TaxID=97972 RepID=A0A2V1DIJ7_9PLEO|nr:hypothetical protein DM02DRAFT_730774 [Periconia macrospinosa]
MVTTRKAVQTPGVSAAGYPTPYASPTEMLEPPVTDRQTRRIRAKKKFDDSLTGHEYDEEIIKQQNAKVQKSKQTNRAKDRKTKDADSSYQRKLHPFMVQRDQTDTYTAKHKAGTTSQTAGPKRLKLKVRAPPPVEEYHKPSLAATPVDISSPVQESDSDDNMIKLVYDKLQKASARKIQLELPYTIDPSDRDSRWTAKQLSDLYLYCYKRKAINLCDMIADTWIRAFHSKNTEVDQNPFANKKTRPWQDESRQYRNPDAVALPNSYFIVGPKLDRSVTFLYHNVDLKAQLQTLEGCETLLDCVNDIYNHTSPNCPARLLWADILALHGHRLEHLLNPEQRCVGDPKEVISGARSEHVVHPDLAFDIMNTALRLVRRKLTLKCEETTKGAWCKKYHLHERYGRKCYQELAEEQHVDPMDVDMDVDGEVEEQSKRVSADSRRVAFADARTEAESSEESSEED